VPKITDPAYFLPEVHATVPFDILTSGVNKPQIVSAICSATYNQHQYVVKYKAADRMSDMACCFELMASFIGMEVGMHIPEPAIVIIDQKFVDTLIGQDTYLTASKSLGQNFGCKYITGYSEALLKQQLSKKLLIEAQNVYAFDAFITNSDRGHNVPPKLNMLTNGEKVLIFDHEIAFGFILELFKSKTPWIFTDKDLTFMRKHHFYTSLNQDGTANFDQFINQMGFINEQFWNKAASLVPQDWMGHFDSIKTNVDLFVQNRNEFKNQLYKSLL
jgi:hypothetical protein